MQEIHGALLARQNGERSACRDLPVKQHGEGRIVRVAGERGPTTFPILREPEEGVSEPMNILHRKPQWSGARINQSVPHLAKIGVKGDSQRAGYKLGDRH